MTPKQSSPIIVLGLSDGLAKGDANRELEGGADGLAEGDANGEMVGLAEGDANREMIGLADGDLFARAINSENNHVSLNYNFQTKLTYLSLGLAD